MIFRHHLGNFSGDKHQGPAVLPIGEMRRHRLRHAFFTSLTDASLKVGGPLRILRYQPCERKVAASLVFKGQESALRNKPPQGVEALGLRSVTARG
jgi:hypothetical protein